MTSFPVLIKTDKTVTEIARGRSMSDLRNLIGADTLETVRLRHLGEPARVMLVDDAGYAKGLPVNTLATAMYLANCRPGTKHQIRGDVVVVFDADFAPPSKRLPADENALWPFPDLARASEGGGLPL